MPASVVRKGKLDVHAASASAEHSNPRTDRPRDGLLKMAPRKRAISWPSATATWRYNIDWPCLESDLEVRHRLRRAVRDLSQRVLASCRLSLRGTIMSRNKLPTIMSSISAGSDSSGLAAAARGGGGDDDDAGHEPATRGPAMATLFCASSSGQGHQLARMIVGTRSDEDAR